MNRLFIIFFLFPICYLSAQKVIKSPENSISGAVNYDEIIREDTIVKDISDEDRILPPPPPKQPKAQDKVYHDFECNPSAKYLDGEKAMYMQLAKQITYPDSAKNSNVEGKVYVEFVINPDGKVTRTKVLRGIGFGCDEVAIKAVKSLKNWSPAKVNGQKVNQRMVLPIRFKLE